MYAAIKDDIPPVKLHDEQHWGREPFTEGHVLVLLQGVSLVARQAASHMPPEQQEAGQYEGH